MVISVKVCSLVMFCHIISRIGTHIIRESSVLKVEAAGRCKISVCLFQTVWCHTVRECGLVLVTDIHIVLIPVQEGLDFFVGCVS